MRTNNSKAKNIIVSIYFILIVLAILSAVFFKAFQDIAPNPLLSFSIVAVILAGLFFLARSSSKFFEYDSDGDKVIVINKPLLLSDKTNVKEHRVEFDKERLIDYKFHNYFFTKRLDLYINGRTGGKKKESFNITLVPRKKRKYIRQSLSKMVKANLKSNQNPA